jgi:hypothetical protein
MVFRICENPGLAASLLVVCIVFASAALHSGQRKRVELCSTGRPKAAAPTRAVQSISTFSSTNFLSFSSEPVSSNEFVTAALPFSTLVTT